MSLKIICSGFLIRHPVGGHTWHHLQYLLGFKRMGHEVTFFEDYGWPKSCYDPSCNVMSSDPSYGINYFQTLLKEYGFVDNWCYIGEDGTSYGISRDHLSQLCYECDIYFNLSNVNWIPELKLCKRRVVIDTDPVFTQIGAHGIGEPFSSYHTLFTYGENVHKYGCEMPTARAYWLPTRQPVILDLWSSEPGDSLAPITSVFNWSSFKVKEYERRVYGQKDREFDPFFSLPMDTGELMELAVSAPKTVRELLVKGGWRLVDPMEVTKTPWTYQDYLRASRAEFCVAKHGYVITQCGWFSDRSSAYMALGRPVIIQDTGFSKFLPCGKGLMPYRTPSQAVAAIREVRADYDQHCRAARSVIEDYFDSRLVLSDLLEKSL